VRRCFAIFGQLVAALAVVSLLALSSQAQRYTFKEYVDGLGNLNVKCIYQDRAGFLWVGTHGGLFRYDGYRFEEFGPNQGLTAPMIEDVREDTSGRLWVATPNGLFVRNGRRFGNVLRHGESLSLRVGSRISLTSDGTVVVSADQGGLYEVVPSPEQPGWQLHRFLSLKFIDPDTAATHGVATAPDGALWFGCGSGMCRYQNDSLTKWGEENGLAKENWEYILFDHEGQVWTRGKSHIAVLRPGAARFELREIPNAPASLDYRSLALDLQGRVLAPFDKQLARFENGHWRILSDANGLEGETVTFAIGDREGSVWIGVLGRGLRRWLGYEAWEHWTKADGLQSNIVWRVLRDPTGRLWVGDDKGVSFMDPGSKQLHRWSAPGISTEGLASIAASKDGFVWLGFRNRYIVRVDSRTGKTQRYPVGDLSQMLVDSHGRVWSASLNGLLMSEPASGEKGRSPFHAVEGNGLPEGGFEDINEAPDGRLWIACDDGLLTGDPDHGWTRVELDSQELSKTLLDVTPDAAGNIWLDGYFTGIVRLRVSGTKVLGVDHLQRPALLSDRYVLLARDQRGWMWFGGDRGLDVFDGLKWRRYTRDDGLIWSDTAAKAFFADDDGSVWIGTGGGLSHFAPSREELKPAPAPAFTWACFSRRDFDNGARVDWSRDPLTIGLASLTFRNEKTIRFRYRLKGLESDWTETTEHEVRYPPLPPGSYRFEAVAMVGTNQPASPVSALAFKVLPPWWRTFTFYAALFATFLGLIYLTWRWSHRRMIAHQRELEVLVKERTRELEADKVELLEAKAALAEQATRDSLTGLLNRSAIFRVLEQEMRRSQRERTAFALVLIDLDDFKQVNEAQGHLMGDELLREFARRLNNNLRPYDHVGRFGGEEFLILMPGLAEESASRIHELHRQLTQEPFICLETELRITCSFGVTWFQSQMITTEALLSLAEQALDSAKANGQNRVEIAESLTPAASQSDPRIGCAK